MNTGPLGVFTITNGKSTPILNAADPRFNPTKLPPVPAPSSGGGGGAPSGYNSTAGGGGASVAASAPAPPPPDPFAAWGGKAAYDSLVSGFNTQHTNINNTSTDAANTSARQINGSILDLLDSVRSGQGKINEASIQNELAKKQGFGSIMDMISHGIQSAGVTLANKNASDSSAAGAIARAYGDIGRRQNNKVNNQYELGNHNIGLQQQDLELQKAQGQRHIHESEDNSVDSIVADARNKLAALDAAIAGANLPQRIAIEQEKNNIKNSVSGIVNSHNNELTSGIAGINPNSADANRASANELSNKGVASTSPFDFSYQTPTQFQGTGPFASELPIFTAPRKK
jgi:hypothetical protein